MIGPPPFDLAGQRFHLLGGRALFWPRHGALIVADLHLEKGSWYASHGQPLPPYDSHDTLDRLAGLVADTGARTLWCLGDSFHDREAADRTARCVAQRLETLADATRIVWVAGNHDGLTAGAWGGEIADELVVDGIVFRHCADPTEERPEISGHYHPKLRLSLRGRSVSRPCFVDDGRRLVLPAFGSLAGGLAVDDPAIARIFSGTYRASAVAGGRLVSIPFARPKTRDATASNIAVRR